MFCSLLNRSFSNKALPFYSISSSQQFCDCLLQFCKKTSTKR
uniref:Uncharacterized protein n=1 Tax=Rhizophora mucronata TaxID=61149 RepID=A0A2P2QDT0_RHIMU